MKKIAILLFSITLLGCNSGAKSKKSETETDKKEVKSTVAVKKATYDLAFSKNTINFTAYKTTEKTPVTGIFKEVKITKKGYAENINDAINGVEFSVKVNSIETNDSSRNYKIIKFFFDEMTESKNLTGKLSITDKSNGFVDLKMNGVINKLPFTYTIDNNVFILIATMDVLNWNASTALKSLNEICLDLHKGSDGVSKTWSEVSIKVSIEF